MESERDRKVKEITNLAAELSFWNKVKVDISEQSGKPTLKEFPTILSQNRIMAQKLIL